MRENRLLFLFFFETKIKVLKSCFRKILHFFTSSFRKEMSRHLQKWLTATPVVIANVLTIVELDVYIYLVKYIL